MLLHKHFQTVIHAAADKIPPITLPLVVNLISAILYKSRGGKEKSPPATRRATYLD